MRRRRLPDSPGSKLKIGDGIALQAGAAAAFSLPVWGVLEQRGMLDGAGVAVWAALAFAVAPLHQLFTAVCWRLELFDRRLTKRFGDDALRLFAKVFVPLLVARPVLVGALALADAGSAWSPGAASLAAGAALAVPAAWTFQSTHRHLGLRRAMGSDHFGERGPLVREGAFRVSGNAMYTFGFLALWALAVAAGSALALVVAAYQHVLIWVHYLVIERPDMQVIYGDREMDRGE